MWFSTRSKLLPGKDGLSFLTDLRKSSDTHNLPIVIVSVIAEGASRRASASELNVVEARQRINKECYDLIILDETLSDGGRTEFLKEIKHPTIILLSATPVPEQRRKSLSAVLRRSENQPLDLLNAVYSALKSQKI